MLVDARLIQILGQRRLESCYVCQCSPHSLREALQGYRSFDKATGLDSLLTCMSAVLMNGSVCDFQEGQSFSKVAQEYSEDKAKG